MKQTSVEKLLGVVTKIELQCDGLFIKTDEMNKQLGKTDITDEHSGGLKIVVCI